MFKHNFIVRQLPGPSCGDPFCQLANYFLFIYRDSGCLIFPTSKTPKNLPDFFRKIPLSWVQASSQMCLLGQTVLNYAFNYTMRLFKIKYSLT